jgi:hypothetical protein
MPPAVYQQRLDPIADALDLAIAQMPQTTNQFVVSLSAIAVNLGFLGSVVWLGGAITAVLIGLGVLNLIGIALFAHQIIKSISVRRASA